MKQEYPRPAIRPNRIRKWVRTKLLAPYLYQFPKDEKTLDLACGWGFSFDINPGFYVLELDDACVSYCQQRGFNVSKGNLLEALPFPDDFFDNCFTHDVLEHFELDEVELIFDHVHRVLKPGGLFMNVTPNKKGFEYGLVIDAGHKHYITPDEIRQIASRTGFEFAGSYSVPVPEFMNRWFVHAKYLTHCRRTRQGDAGRRG